MGGCMTEPTIKQWKRRALLKDVCAELEKAT